MLITRQIYLYIWLVDGYIVFVMWQVFRYIWLVDSRIVLVTLQIYWYMTEICNHAERNDIVWSGDGKGANVILSSVSEMPDCVLNPIRVIVQLDCVCLVFFVKQLRLDIYVLGILMLCLLLIT